MRVFFGLLFVFFIIGPLSHKTEAVQYEDNEFAEFEDFDEGQINGEVPTINNDEATVQTKVAASKDEDDDDTTVESEEDDFEEWDPEEFEGKPSNKPEAKKADELNIVEVPFRNKGWSIYYVEIIIGSIIIVYLINFLVGSSKNNSIASAWLQTHLSFLKSQFELVGDDLANQTPTSTHQMTKESEHTYVLWCSGRQFCKGMLVQIKLLKRQDIISSVINYFTPANDQLQIKIALENMDPFVFCMGLKKSVIALQKNMTDVSLFCGDRLKSGEKFGFASSISILSELPGEVIGAILDAKVAKVLKSHEHLIDSIHISDQFSGLKPLDQEEVPQKEPETSKVININLNIPTEWRNTDHMEKLLPLVKLAVYLVDKVSRLRLSRESKSKADKHRHEMHLRFLKQTHAQRQEAAQLKREEKDRLLKDRMMNEEDPEKQRRLDEMIQRREQNKKNKKLMKGRQCKIKAM